MADDPTRYLDVSGVLALKAGATVDVDYTVTHANSVAARLGEVGAQANSALVRATSAGETASTALSSAGRAVAETHETRSLLEQYLDSSEDPSAPTGAKSEALERAYRRGVSVAEFGAVGDDVTDDTAAIQAAADAAHAAGATLYFPPGKYLTTGMVTILGSVQAEDSATIRYHGAGTALHVGGSTKDEIMWRLHLHLPKVEHRTTAWDGTSVGVRLVNLNACTVTIPYVREFEHGVIMEGRGQGFGYNTIHMGSLWYNHVQLWMTADTADGGWANQNTFIGGRWHLPSTYVGGKHDDPSACQVRLVADAVPNGPNNNTFVGCSFESDNVGYYLMDIGGRYNIFVNCRWEALTLPTRIRWRAGSVRNEVIGGYDLWRLIEVYDDPSGINVVRDPEGAYGAFKVTSGQIIQHDTRTPVTYWDLDLSRGTPQDRATGKFTPKRGLWRVTARLTYTSNNTGARGAYLFYQGASSSGPSTLAASETPAGAGRATVTVSGTRRFDGTTAVWVEAHQSSGGALPLVTSSGMNSIEFEYLGA